MPQLSSIASWTEHSPSLDARRLHLVPAEVNEEEIIYDFGGNFVTGASQTSGSLDSGDVSFNMQRTPSTRPLIKADPSAVSGAIVRRQLKNWSVIQKRGAALQTRQLWIGTVTEVGESSFVAILRDRTKPSNPDEQATFELNEISEEDRPLVSVGSTFYWVVGREQSVAKSITNVSKVRFRRLPMWTKSALKRASTKAERLQKALGTGNDPTNSTSR